MILRCVRCHRRIKDASAQTAIGPVGPICALMSELLPGSDSVPKAPRHVTVRHRRAGRVGQDDRQRDWILSAQMETPRSL